MRLALLALLLLAGPAQGLQASEHGWHWRILQGQAQVRDDLVLQGPGADVRLQLPPGARDVQAFVDDRAAAWEWVRPGLLQVRAPRLDEPGAEVHLRVLYVVPVGPAGARAERVVQQDTARLTLTAEAPAEWAASLEGGGVERAGLRAGDSLAATLAPPPPPSPIAVLAGLLALMLALAMARAARARSKAGQPMGLLGHLRELQSRLRIVGLALALVMLFLFTFSLQPARLGGVEVLLPTPSLEENVAAQTFRLLAQQFVPPGVELVVVDPISGALVQVEVALFLAVLVVSPLAAYEVGAFLAPALERRERRVLLKAIPAVTGLFAAGAAFAYFLMVPTMMRVLYTYAAGLGARPLIAVDSLVSFAVIVTLLFGLAFELPVGMAVVARLGLVTPRAMAKAWRHAVLGIFVAAAVITPDPSVVSQVLVAGPLLLLFGLGLLAARMVAPEAAPAAQGRAQAARP